MNAVIGQLRARAHRPIKGKRLGQTVLVEKPLALMRERQAIAAVANTRGDLRVGFSRR